MTKLIKYIKEEEFVKLLKAETKKEFKLAYLFGFGSGLRISEIIGLEHYYSKCCNELATSKYDFDENNKELLVTSCSKCGQNLTTKTMYRKVGAWKIKPLTAEQIDLQAKTIKVIGGKGMKDRIVPLFPNFKEEYLKMLPLGIKRTTLQTHFKVLCKRVLGRNSNFHQLRHGFGVWATKKRIPMPFIQHAMGHSRLDTTGIYTAASPEDMLDAFKKGWGE
jgi:integrase